MAIHAQPFLARAQARHGPQTPVDALALPSSRTRMRRKNKKTALFTTGAYHVYAFVVKRAVCRATEKNTSSALPLIKVLEQFHFEITLAAARADARREGVSAIYLRG